MDSYWKDREEQAQLEYSLTEEQYVEQLNDIYDYMLDQVKKEINGFYSKYATKEGITMAEAQKRVAQVDIDEYERKAKKYVAEKDFSDQANREMRLYNLTMKVNRLQMLEANIGLETVSGLNEIDERMGEYLTDRALQEMSRQAGILGATVQNNAKTASSIVGASFHNATFSDRIWMYQAQLRDELDGLLRNGLIQGQNPNELARHINNLFDTGKYNCERLLRTELTRVQSDAQLQSFIAAGFDEYQFNALGDACPVCRELDEQHFRIADAEPGENLPPIHPNCRCAVSAYMDDESYNEWLDSYKDHGMSYEDWLENRPTVVEAEQTPGGIYAENAGAIKAALHKVEESTRGFDHESGTIIDLQGNILNTTRGSDDAVEPPEELLPGNIFTHNHPSGGCFSLGDIQSMIDYGLYELRASTPQGTYYSLKVADGATPDAGIISAYAKCDGYTIGIENLEKDIADGVVGKLNQIDYYYATARYVGVARGQWLAAHASEYGLIFETGEI